MTDASQPRQPVVTTREVALRIVERLGQSMDRLTEILSEESRLVAAGHLKAAAELVEEKNDQAALFVRLALVVRDEIEAMKAMAPEETAALIERHELFRASTQENLEIMQNAKGLAESLMRTVASEFGASQLPKTYGRSGHHRNDREVSAQGIAINQRL